MATYGFGSSFSTSAVLASLSGYGDIAVVQAGIIVSSTDNSGIVGTDSAHYALIRGTLTADYYGVQLGNNPAGDNSERILIEKGGEVFGANTGLYLVACKSTITNNGYVYGTSYGVVMTGDNTTTTTTLTNPGTIESVSYAIYNAGTERVSINNSGTIKGYYTFNGADNTGKITLTNTGTMNATDPNGGISLGTANDTYDGRKGHANGGTVFGRAGDDKLYGGTEANKIDGGADNDRLYGGGGNDTLIGGTGSDRFYFTDALKSAGIDKVTDFSNKNGEDDRIYLEDSVFKALGSSVTSGEFIKVTSGHGAKQGNDHLIYNTKDGSLWYDADGSGKGAAVHIATLSNKATIDYHDFFIA